MSLPITTTDYPLPETTVSSGELYAEYISAPASSMSPAAIAEHMQQNQITFEIPTAHDLRHIDALHSFNTLLQRIGNAAVSYDSSPPASISTEQLSNSVVLDLADLREHNDADANSVWEQIFGDADMHAIVNYLWIGVVTSLVLLSLVFIMFSCYFYRKFRTWKKCSKYSLTDAPCPCPPPLLCADLVTFIKMLSLSLFFFLSPCLGCDLINGHLSSCFGCQAKQYKVQSKTQLPPLFTLPPPPPHSTLGNVMADSLINFGALRNCQALRIPMVCLL